MEFNLIELSSEWTLPALKFKEGVKAKISGKILEKI